MSKYIAMTTWYPEPWGVIPRHVIIFEEFLCVKFILDISGYLVHMITNQNFLRYIYFYNLLQLVNNMHVISYE